MVMHALVGGQVITLEAELRNAVSGVEIEAAPLTTVIGIHTWPGLFGIAWERTD